MTSTLLAADLKYTGASLAFTSDDPAVVHALKMLDDGNYSRTEKFIATTQPSDDPNVTKARAELLDVIGRMRLEYTLDEAGLLAKIQRRIPDATDRDITHWREAGDLGYAIIDSKLLYFGREPQNLFYLLRGRQKAIAPKHICQRRVEPGRSSSADREGC